MSIVWQPGKRYSLIGTAQADHLRTENQVLKENGATSDHDEKVTWNTWVVLITPSDAVT